MDDLAHFQSPTYRLLAQARHALNPGTWPYFAERLRRRLMRESASQNVQQKANELYTSSVVPPLEALRLLGIAAGSAVAADAADFAQGHMAVSSLGIPFEALGIAGPSDTSLLRAICGALQPRNVLETGVALGWSTLVILREQQSFGGKLISVDLPYPFLMGDRWVGAVVPKELRKNWKLIRMADRWGLPLALRRQPFDLIHYDSDKSAAGRKWAYPKLWASLDSGGVLISDDIGDNAAWAQFCACIEHPLIVVDRGRALTGLARKK